ncbi:MAG: hypothetical protein IIB77_14850, partial [Proteobacteria bacterium]|nr:hypothetical protein [Pseudomonadota bacterium]
EKMPGRVSLVARGTPGHGSVPLSDNAVSSLAQAVAKAGAWKTQVRLNDTTRAYFDRLAAWRSFGAKELRLFREFHEGYRRRTFY